MLKLGQLYQRNNLLKIKQREEGGLEDIDHLLLLPFNFINYQIETL